MFLAASDARTAPSATGFFAALRYLGQLDLTYLACEGDGELVLVDQHVAHERVELARLRDRADGSDSPVSVQKLLFPTTFEVTPAQLALVARVGETLAQVGFRGRAVLRQGDARGQGRAEASLRHGDPAQLLRGLLQRWVDADEPSEADQLETLLGEIARHAAVRAGDRMTPGDAEVSAAPSLDGLDLALPAPHDRAVLVRLPLSELARRFSR